MTCQNCQTDSGVYDLKLICCAARMIDKQISAMCRKYGHTRADLRQAMARVKQAERKPVAGEAAR
jgi:hypothetical protein